MGSNFHATELGLILRKLLASMFQRLKTATMYFSFPVRLQSISNFPEPSESHVRSALIGCHIQQFDCHRPFTTLSSLYSPVLLEITWLRDELFTSQKTTQTTKKVKVTAAGDKYDDDNDYKCLVTRGRRTSNSANILSTSASFKWLLSTEPSHRMQ